MKQTTTLAMAQVGPRPSQTQAIETLVESAGYHLVNQVPSDWAAHKETQPYLARVVYNIQRAVVSLEGEQLFNRHVQLLDRADLLIGSKIPVDPE